MHLNSRRAAVAAVIATALAATATACGATTFSGPLAGQDSGTILNKALADTKTAPSLSIHLVGSDSGSKLTIDSTIISGTGCQGTMAESGQGSFKFIDNGKTGWINADAAFWKANGGGDPAVLSMFVGKYLKTNDKSLTGTFTQFCDLTQLLSGFSGPAAGMPQSQATLNGQPAIKLSDTGDKAVLYVSDTAKPVLLKLNDPSPGGETIDFSGYGAGTQLTLPPSSQVVNGDKYGM